MPNGLDGNLIGLNPFHDYPAWQVINSARLVGAKRTDNCLVSDQINDVKVEILAQYQEWASKH